MITCKNLKGNDHGLTEILSRDVPAGIQDVPYRIRVDSDTA